MPRFDLYTPAHKAVRALLFDALAAVAGTDFERAEELAPTLLAVRRALRLTRRQAEREERALHPLLQPLAPELVAQLAAEHARAGALGLWIERDLARLEHGSPAERVALGRRVHERLGLLAAGELAHLALEESRANRLLWAHHADEALAALEERAFAALDAAEASEWLEWLLPACHAGERAALLARLRAALSPAAFAARTAAARDWLGAQRWNEALAEAEEHAGTLREAAAS